MALEHRQERGDDEEQREREIPNRDVQSPPQVRDLPEIDHLGRVAIVSARATRRRGGTTRPRRAASHMNTIVRTTPASTEYMLASGPNSPPLSRVGPDVTPFSRPSDSP